MIIQPNQLSEFALQKIVEEFILREGTDYGHSEHSLSDKTAQVMKQLHRGDVVISFDEKSETLSIQPKGLVSADTE
jgi:uncharacterized protein YheU (UPF0270 family)